MSVVDAIHLMCLLFAHLLQRCAKKRLTFEEKMSLLRLMVHLMLHPHDGVVRRGGALCLTNTIEARALDRCTERKSLPPFALDG